MAVELRQGDRKLLEDLCDGDATAFWAIWMEHTAHLRAVCYRHMQRVRTDTDDAVSRSMMIAREKLPEYASEIVDVKAWLTRLTSNVCLDIKKERCRGTRKADPLDDNVLNRREATLLDPPTPEDACFASQVREHIGQAFAQLPPGLGAAAQLRFLHEASYTTIAERLSITETAARKRVQKARVVLRRELASLVTSLPA
ncbi:MAG: sigma-70 family RNA polymerase sigma factor [Acidobacteria bacterium]|nr:sigma-70 family RNA polymerase sigma factor [Acidobacteriota bacterium]